MLPVAPHVAVVVDVAAAEPVTNAFAFKFCNSTCTVDKFCCPVFVFVSGFNAATTGAAFSFIIEITDAKFATPVVDVGASLDFSSATTADIVGTFILDIKGETVLSI